MNNNTYNHTDFSGDFISLHDCTATEIGYADGVLSLTFDGGFWMKEVHHANKQDKNVRTGKAKVEFTSESAPAIFVFKKNLFGKLTKKELAADALAELVKSKSTELKILGQFPADNGILIKCWAKDTKSDKVSECHIELTPKKTRYYW